MSYTRYIIRLENVRCFKGQMIMRLALKANVIGFGKEIKKVSSETIK